MNAITIVSDTLRHDCVAFHGQQPHGWDLAQPIRTPCLDRFAETAAVFDHAYTGSFATIPMRTDLFTGKWTFPHRGWTPLPADETIRLEQHDRYADCRNEAECLHGDFLELLRSVGADPSKIDVVGQLP